MNNKNTQKINFVPISISEYYKWIYVSVNGTDLPTFALRPVITSSKINNNQINESQNDVLTSKQTKIYRQMTF